MDRILYYLILAITTTYCMLITNDKVSKTLLAMGTTCWWLLAIGEIITKVL